MPVLVFLQFGEQMVYFPSNTGWQLLQLRINLTGLDSRQHRKMHYSWNNSSPMIALADNDLQIEVLSSFEEESQEALNRHVANGYYKRTNDKRSKMSGIVLTFPILAGKVEAWRRFCQELSGSRRKPYEASRQRLGITRERLALVETDFGSTAVTTLEAPDVGLALGQIIASDLPFDVWYRQRLQELHGVNLAGYEQFSQRSPPPKNQEVHFEWSLNSHSGG
jgi:hypothetical protein